MKNSVNVLDFAEQFEVLSDDEAREVVGGMSMMCTGGGIATGINDYPPYILPFF